MQDREMSREELLLYVDAGTTPFEIYFSQNVLVGHLAKHFNSVRQEIKPEIFNLPVSEEDLNPVVFKKVHAEIPEELDKVPQDQYNLFLNKFLESIYKDEKL